MRKIKKRITGAAAFVLLLALILSAGAQAIGVAVYTNTRMLADNLELTNTVSWSADSGRTESFSVAMTGAGDAYPIVVNGDTVYGGFTISKITQYAQDSGLNVLAVVNTDFFVQNAVAMGVVIENGRYISSTSERNAIAFQEDGGVSFIESPNVSITLQNNGAAENTVNAGKSSVLWNLNKNRYDDGGMVLYTQDFSSVSTRTKSPGWFVRFKVIDGSMTVSGTMTLEVTETAEAEGEIPIGEGYLVLTAAETSAYAEEFGKYAVGDSVTLTTSCGDERLVSARYATGGGDILVKDGAKTDPAAWDRDLRSYRAPRTAFGMRADGTVVSYVADGRNPDHSTGLNLDELADEMIGRGCVYAVNLDGGGSTALSVKMPGADKAAVINKPSDGSERITATFLMYVTDAQPDGIAKRLNIINDGAIVLAGSEARLSYGAADAGYMPAPVPDDITAVSAFGAQINGDVYTASESASGIDKILLESQSTGAAGIGEIFVVSTPTSITVTRKETATPLTYVKLPPGTTLSLDVRATYYRRPVISQAGAYEYAVAGNIGEMTEPAVFTAGMTVGETGTITVSAGGRKTAINIEIYGFADMVDHWAADYVDYLMQMGITNGITETEYGPSSQMKRCDYILMLYRAAGEPEIRTVVGFDDTPEGAYYGRALIWARENGIAEAADGNSFYPQLPVARQDAFTFTYRCLAVLNKAYEDGDTGLISAFPDARELAQYAAVPVDTLIKLGVVEGSDGYLLPQGTMTRAQMAKVLALVIQLPAKQITDNG